MHFFFKCCFHCVFWLDSVTRKLAHYMVDVLEEHQDRIMENLLANGRE